MLSASFIYVASIYKTENGFRGMRKKNIIERETGDFFDSSVCVQHVAAII